MKVLLLSCIVVVLFLSISTSNKTKLGSDIFPETEGWKKSDDIRIFNANNLWDIINGAADLYIQYDFQELQIAEYTNKEKATIVVEIYRHRDPACAFGIYSQERPEKGNFITVGGQGYKEESILNFFVKDCYIKIRSHNNEEVTKNAISDIAEKLSENIETDPAVPETIGFFPAMDKLDNTEQYINKNFMGLGFLNSAFVTKYSGDDKNFTLFIITKETPEECKTMLKEYLKFSKHETQDPEQKQYTIYDPYNGKIFIIWNGNYIWGTSNLEDDELCQEYLQLIKKKLTEKKVISYQ